MARLRIGHSYWLDAFAGRPLRLPALRGRHRADIAIVGGGVTGCAAALLFARAGARGRAGRGSPDRPRQHRREHGAPDAGAGRGFP